VYPIAVALSSPKFGSYLLVGEQRGNWQRRRASAYGAFTRGSTTRFRIAWSNISRVKLHRRVGRRITLSSAATTGSLGDRHPPVVSTTPNIPSPAEDICERDGSLCELVPRQSFRLRGQTRTYRSAEASNTRIDHYAFPTRCSSAH